MNHKDYFRSWYAKLTFRQKFFYQWIHFWGMLSAYYWIIRAKLGFPYKDKNIFLVTTLCKLQCKSAADYRIVGFYYKRRQAILAVRRNSCDLWETIYPYAMIEEIEPGLYGNRTYAGLIGLYEYDMATGKYLKIAEPETFEPPYTMG